MSIVAETKYAIEPRDVFVSRSGRRWQVSPTRFDRPGFVMLIPLGATGFGGVKARQVELERLENETHGWSRLSRA